jgi:hypothetical protein
MDMKTWLRTFLDGNKLEVALTKCKEAAIDTLDDLVDCSKDGGKAELQQIFPHMIAKKIHFALTELEKNGGQASVVQSVKNESQQEFSKDQPKEGGGSKSVTTAPSNSEPQLPDGFKWHYFAS